MSGSLNKVMLIGHCGQDPEVKPLANDQLRASVSLATSERYTDKTTGERKETTEWHYLVAFGKAAEIISAYVQKGSLIHVEGKIKTSTWTDKHGMERSDKQIIVDQIKLLGKPKNAATETPSQNQAVPMINEYAKATGRSSVRSIDELDDDIPF